MSWRDCIDEIRRAAGRELSDDELDDLLTELQRRSRQRRAERQGEAADEAMRGAAEDYARDMAEAAKIEKRNAAINLRRRLETLDFVRTRFAGDPALGLEAALVGVNRPVPGARLSAGAEQNALKHKYLAGFTADVEAKGLWKVFVRGELDRDVARALWARDRDAPMPDVPREAVEIAEVIAKWQEAARLDANRAGAWIRRAPGYIVRQSHDMWKIREAGYEAWRDEILPRLDPDRTFQGDDAEPFLKAVYEGLASGIHLRARDGDTGFRGPRNIAKRLSAERVLHFKSADDWFDYNQRFGSRSLREALLRGFEVNAQATGLMRRLGPNPEANFNRITDELTRGIDDDARREKFAQLVAGKLRNQLAELDGTTRLPVNRMGARISSNVRMVQRMAKLGASLMSQFGDIALYASEMRYQGRGMLSGIAESTGNVMRGRGSAERREIGGMIGVYSDLMTGDIAARFSISDDDVPGRMARLQQTFFKWNGMAWWTDRQRAGAIYAMSHRLAMNKGRPWTELDSDLQRVLGLFGIGDPEWGIVRAAAARQADGRDYVVPEAVAELPDNPFADVLQRQGVEATPRRVNALRREIADKLRAYFADRSTFAVIMPDQRTRAFMQRGTRPGTVEGDFMRFIGELKSFPVAVVEKAVGREIYGRGAGSLPEALRNGNGEMLGLAQLILWTTAFGYLSMSAKDLLKGREPRDPLSWKTFQAAMWQGGGMGIYGDFLFGEVRNRFGGTVLSTLAGPTLGAVEDLADIYGRLRDGDDAAAATFRFALSNTPFLNLFYSRIALDYLILWQAQEWLSPGSMKRLERRVEKENAQQFLIRPSEVVR